MEAADEIQEERIEEPSQPTVHTSNRHFKFGDGGSESANLQMKQPITTGILKGKSVDFHLIDFRVVPTIYFVHFHTFDE